MCLSYPSPTAFETVLQRYQLPLTALRHLRNTRNIRLNGKDSVDQQLRIGDGECYLESRIRAVMLRVYPTASPGEMTRMKSLLTCNAFIKRLLATATEEGFVVDDWKAMNALVCVEDPQGLEVLLEEIFAPDLFAAAEVALRAESKVETDAENSGEDKNDFRAYQEASNHALGPSNACFREHCTFPTAESSAKVPLDSSPTPHFPTNMPFTFRSSLTRIPQHAEPGKRFLVTPPEPDPSRYIGLAEGRTGMNLSAPSMEPQNNWDGRRVRIANDKTASVSPTAPLAVHPGRHVPAQGHFTFPSSLRPPHAEFGHNILYTVPGSTAWGPPDSNATMGSQMMAGSPDPCESDNNSIYGTLSSTATPPDVQPSRPTTPTETAFTFRCSFPLHPKQLELERSFSFTQP